MAAADEWFVEDQGRIEGPLPASVLMARRFAGFLGPGTRLSRDGHSFKSIQELEAEGSFGGPANAVPNPEQPRGMLVVCPHCAHENHAPRSAEGKKGKCPQCKEWLIVHEGVAEPVDAPIDHLDLRKQVQSYVSQQLKTPASAQFSAQDADWRIEKLIDGRVIVTSVVDAQNVYGAVLRHEFTCILKKEAGNSGRWSLESCELKEWSPPAALRPLSTPTSEDATAPPPNQLNSKLSTPVILVSLLLTGVFLFYMTGLYRLTGWHFDRARGASDESGMARVMAQQLVKQQLKSPSTAEFSWSDSDWSVVKLGNGDYRVSSFVDAQNSFGAVLRNDFTVVVRRDPNNPDSWILVACNIVGR